MKPEYRTIERIQVHYEIEKKLADRLRNATKDERLNNLYAKVYDDYFEQLDDAPQLVQKQSRQEKERLKKYQFNLLKSFLNQNMIFLEVGPGDCFFPVYIASYVKKVYAVDVSKNISKGIKFPDNFQLFLSDGIRIPCNKESIDLAYSHQLMEHLHPEDAYDQLQNIYNALAPGGTYICITPNYLNGPHDISKYFDRTPTGFHLKEYSIQELSNLFKRVGFKKILFYWGGKGLYIKIPVTIPILFEKMLAILPYKIRKIIACNKLIGTLLGIRLIGIK